MAGLSQMAQVPGWNLDPDAVRSAVLIAAAWAATPPFDPPDRGHLRQRVTIHLTDTLSRVLISIRSLTAEMFIMRPFALAVTTVVVLIVGAGQSQAGFLVTVTATNGIDTQTVSAENGPYFITLSDGTDVSLNADASSPATTWPAVFGRTMQSFLSVNASVVSRPLDLTITLAYRDLNGVNYDPYGLNPWFALQTSGPLNLGNGVTGDVLTRVIDYGNGTSVQDDPTSILAKWEFRTAAVSFTKNPGNMGYEQEWHLHFDQGSYGFDRGATSYLTTPAPGGLILLVTALPGVALVWRRLGARIRV